jgi:hypothetical protein
MNGLRPAVAVAIVLVLIAPPAPGGDLLDPERPIAAAVDHYIDAALRKEAVTPPPGPTTRPSCAG